MNNALLFARIKAQLRRKFRLGIQSMRIMPTPAICENVVLWGQDRGYQTIRIHDPFILDFAIPDCISIHPRLRTLFQLVNGLGYPSQHLITLPEATVQGDHGMLSFENGCYISENHWRVSNVYENPIYRKEWPISERRHLPGDWYCLMGHWGNNYNHWLWDELPRFMSALPHLPSTTRFLISSTIPNTFMESLAALGIAPERCLRQKYHMESTVERLWFATPLGHSEHSSTAPDVARRLRDIFLKQHGHTAPTNKRRVYVSRSHATIRRLLNEAEVIQFLTELGFEIIHAEKLSFAEQVGFFSECSIVMGQHGAGLTNIFFAPDKSRLLEIHGPVTRCHYWMMASILGHDYNCFFCESDQSHHHTGQYKLPDFQIGELDYAVPMTEFKKWVHQAITERNVLSKF